MCRKKEIIILSLEFFWFRPDGLRGKVVGRILAAANLMSKFLRAAALFFQVKKAESPVDEFDGTSTKFSAFIITSFRERMK